MAAAQLLLDSVYIYVLRLSDESAHECLHDWAIRSRREMESGKPHLAEWENEYTFGGWNCLMVNKANRFMRNGSDMNWFIKADKYEICSVGVG